MCASAEFFFLEIGSWYMMYIIYIYIWCILFFVISSFSLSARSLNFGDSRFVLLLWHVQLGSKFGHWLRVWKHMETSYKSTCFVVFICLYIILKNVLSHQVLSYITLHFVYGRIKVYHKWLLCGLLLKVPYGLWLSLGFELMSRFITNRKPFEKQLHFACRRSSQGRTFWKFFWQEEWPCWRWHFSRTGTGDDILSKRSR